MALLYKVNTHFRIISILLFPIICLFNTLKSPSTHFSSFISLYLIQHLERKTIQKPRIYYYPIFAQIFFTDNTLWTRSRCISELLFWFKCFQLYFFVNVLSHPHIHRKQLLFFAINKNIEFQQSKFLLHNKILIIALANHVSREITSIYIDSIEFIFQCEVLGEYYYVFDRHPSSLADVPYKQVHKLRFPRYV